MKPTPKMTLDEAIHIVTEELAGAEMRLGQFPDDPAAWSSRHQRHRAEMKRLATVLEERLAARITDRWDAARVRICGIASTSTSGLAGAMHNWLRAAQKRL